MTHSSVLEALNRLLRVLHRSLPMYLADGQPWTGRRDDPAEETLRNVVADQQDICIRLADYIIDGGGTVDDGEYPMEFTDLNFLALDSLLPRLVEYQKEDVATIEHIIAWLPADEPEALALAQEALGQERAHLEMLESVQAVAV